VRTQLGELFMIYKRRSLHSSHLTGSRSNNISSSQLCARERPRVVAPRMEFLTLIMRKLPFHITQRAHTHTHTPHPYYSFYMPPLRSAFTFPLVFAFSLYLKTFKTYMCVCMYYIRAVVQRECQNGIHYIKRLINFFARLG
jgi:hypothetical protein